MTRRVNPVGIEPDEASCGKRQRRAGVRFFASAKNAPSDLWKALHPLLLQGVAQRQHERHPVPIDGLQPSIKLDDIDASLSGFHPADIALPHPEALRNIRLRHAHGKPGLAKHGQKSGAPALVHREKVRVELTIQNGLNTY